MTPEQLAALVADKETGTPGPLVVSDFCMEGSHMTSVAFPDRFGVPGDTVAEFFSNWRDASRKEYRISWAQAEANARRFARVPELEDVVIALVAERDALSAEVARLSTPPNDAEVLAIIKDVTFEAVNSEIDRVLAGRICQKLARLSHALAARRKE